MLCITALINIDQLNGGFNIIFRGSGRFSMFFSVVFQASTGKKLREREKITGPVSLMLNISLLSESIKHKKWKLSCTFNAISYPLTISMYFTKKSLYRNSYAVDLLRIYTANIHREFTWQKAVNLQWKTILSSKGVK